MISGTGGANEKRVTSLRSACPLFSCAELCERIFLVIEYDLVLLTSIVTPGVWE